jgi:hypothetical protein
MKWYILFLIGALINENNNHIYETNLCSLFCKREFSLLAKCYVFDNNAV